MIEPNRTYPGVDAIRAAAARDLDEGVLLALGARPSAICRRTGFAVRETLGAGARLAHPSPKGT